MARITTPRQYQGIYFIIHLNNKLSTLLSFLTRAIDDFPNGRRGANTQYSMHDFGMSAFTYLQQQQVIESFRSFANTLLNSLDDTGYFCFESIHCPSCAVAHHSDGRTSCSHSVVIPAIAKPGCSQVIPLEPEFIVHQDGHKKQDCEQMGARFCRGCGYYLRCPEDIPIPTVKFLKVFSIQMPKIRS